MAEIWLEMVVKQQFVSLLIFVTPSMYGLELSQFTDHLGNKISIRPYNGKIASSAVTAKNSKLLQLLYLI